MSENTEPVVQTGADTFVIPRNGVELTLKPYRILKGKRENTVYQAPEVTAGNWQQIVEWYGTSNFISDFQTWLKRKFQSIHTDSVGDDGVFNKELFAKYAAELTSAGLKLKEINIKLDELMAESIALGEREDFGSPESIERIREINGQVKAYRQMREDRQRKPKDEDEAEASIPA